MSGQSNMSGTLAQFARQLNRLLRQASLSASLSEKNDKFLLGTQCPKLKHWGPGRFTKIVG